MGSLWGPYGVSLSLWGLPVPMGSVWGGYGVGTFDEDLGEALLVVHPTLGGALWGLYGVSLSLWGLPVPMGTLWGLPVPMGSLCPYGVSMGSPCPYGVSVTLWGPYGVVMESVPLTKTSVKHFSSFTLHSEGHYGVPMGSLWGLPVPMGSPCPYGVGMGWLWGRYL